MTLAEPYVQVETAVAVGRLGGKPFIGFAKVDMTEAARFGTGYDAQPVAGDRGVRYVTINPARPGGYEQRFHAAVLFPTGLGVIGSTPEVSEYVSRCLSFAEMAQTSRQGSGAATALELFQGPLFTSPEIHTEPAWEEDVTGTHVHHMLVPARFAAYFPREDAFGIAERTPGAVRVSMIRASGIEDDVAVYTILRPVPWNQRNRAIRAHARRVPHKGECLLGKVQLTDSSPVGAETQLVAAFEGSPARVVERDYSQWQGKRFMETPHDYRMHVDCAAAAVWDSAAKRWSGAVLSNGQMIDDAFADPPGDDVPRGMVSEHYRDVRAEDAPF